MKTRTPDRTRCRVSRLRDTAVALTLVIALVGMSFPMVGAQDLYPRFVGYWSPTEYGVISVVVRDGFAFCASPADGLTILDIRNPENPQRVGGFDAGDALLGVAVSGNYSYLANHSAGMQVIDIRDLHNPQRVGRFNTAVAARGVAIAGSYAYIVESDWDPKTTHVVFTLEVVNISDPANPRGIGRFSTNENWGDARSLVVSDRYVYVAAHNAGLRIFDVSDPSNPRPIGSTLRGYGVYDVAVLGNYAYLASWFAALLVVDVSDPTRPRQVNSIGPFQAQGATDYAGSVTVANGYAYLAHQFGGLQIFDIKDPVHPRRVGGYDTRVDAQAIAVWDRYAFVATDSRAGPMPLEGLQIIDIGTPANLRRRGSYDTAADARRVAVSGNYAVVGDFSMPDFEKQSDVSGGLRVIDISDPGAPHQVGNYDMEGVEAVAVSDRFVYLTGDRWDKTTQRVRPGVMVLDIGDPSTPRVEWRYETIGYLMAISGNLAYLYEQMAPWRYRLEVVDFRNPVSPIRIGAYEWEGIGEIYDGAVAGNFAYLSTSYRLDEESHSGLHVIDVSDPAQPRLKGVYDMGSDRGRVSVAVSGLHAYMADPFGGLLVIDVSNPGEPRRVGDIGFDASRHRMQDLGVKVLISGRCAYVATMHGLDVIDVSNPANPKRVGGNTAFSAFDITVGGDKVFVAGGKDGLIILDTFTMLRFGPARILNDGRIHLQLGGASGQSVRVQRSPNLVDWEHWKTVTLGENVSELIDTIASTSPWFYRAVEGDFIGFE